MDDIHHVIDFLLAHIFHIDALYNTVNIPICIQKGA